MNRKIQISFSVIISLFSLGSFLLWALYAYSPITLQAISELIPDSAVVDTNAASQLESTIYFVRQSYFAAPTWDLKTPYLIYAINLLISLTLLLIGLKKWASINLFYIIGGIFLWTMVIFWTNQFANWQEIGLVVVDQLLILGTLSLLFISLFTSAAIPRLLFQLGHSQNLAQSQRNWIYFLGFYMGNLILTYGKQFLFWEINLAIPSIFFGLMAWIAYSFQASSMNMSLRWGISLAGFSTLFLFLLTGNDPGIAALEHWVLICQIVMILLFPLFIFSNFKIPIRQNLPVYKIIHKAPHLDIRIIYIGVAILGSAWIFAKNGSVLHQFQSAFNNERGDIAQIFQDKQAAEFAYQQAMLHSKLNAKSNVSLAAMALEANDAEAAAYYLSTSHVKHANPITIIALAQIYQQAEKPFESLFTLQQAQKKFPTSAEINTQLAKQFEVVQAKDSANFYYQQAFQKEPSNLICQGNILYATHQSNPTLAKNENSGIQANFIAIGLKKGDKTLEAISPSNLEPGNDLRIWSHIYNANMLKKGQAKRLPIAWEKDPAILQVFPEIKLLFAWQDYYHDKPLKALQKINLQIANDTTSKTEGLQQILSFWKQSLLEHRPINPIRSLQDAKIAIQRHPFQVDVLQQALPILNSNKLEKQAYDAALAALQWNENIPVYYLIFAMQAYQLGEIAYGEEAVNRLKKLSVSTYQTNQKTLDFALDQARRRQKFE